jgi:hypothetical protein
MSQSTTKPGDRVYECEDACMPEKRNAKVDSNTIWLVDYIGPDGWAVCTMWGFPWRRVIRSWVRVTR